MGTRSDSYIITGMADIINPDNIKPGIDLRELEKTMISGGVINEPRRDKAEDRFEKELRETAQRLGIEFNGNDSDESDEDTPRSPMASPRRSPVRDMVSHTYQPSPTRQSFTTQSPTRQSPSRFSYQASPVRYSTAPASPDRNYTRSPARYSTAPAFTRTNEQERRSTISSIVGGTQDISVSLDRERMEDAKMSMLAEIDDLYATLKREGSDLSRVVIPDADAEYNDVEKVLKILRHKNDHIRYRTFAEEFLIFGAHMLGDICNGERVFFNRYRPNLKGWHNNVSVKLERMQHDTSKIVNSVIQNYDIGPGTRLLVELVPNMVLYSKAHSTTQGQNNVFSDMEMQ